MQRLSSATLANLVEGLPVGVVAWEIPEGTEDPRDLVLIGCNAKAEEQGGFALGDFAGQRLGDLFPDVADEQIERLRRASVDGEVVGPFEDSWLDRWFNVTFRPLGNRVLGVYYADIHEKKTAIEARERLDADMDQFAYAASHDLQEPLRAVTNYATLLEEEFGGQLGEDGELYLRYVVDSAKRMRSMIDGLLAFSRVGRNEVFDVVSVDEVLDDAIVNLETTIEENGATITKDPLPSVVGDAHMLIRLFQNLISNGIKFRNGLAPRVHISATDSGSEWIFSVSDNGVGIEPRFRDRVFVIFQRLRKDRPGTGMGLAICKKIVERHGGRIWIEASPTGGTTVRFTLRKAAPDEEWSTKTSAGGGGQPGGRADGAQSLGNDDLDARGLCRPRWSGGPPVPQGGGSVLQLEAPRPRPAGSEPTPSEWPRSAGGTGR